MADGSNGWAADKVFDGASSGYSYDDIIFMPGHVNFKAADVDLSSRLSKNIALNTPLVSGPMSTVTEAYMAICLALKGGIGIIHCRQSVQDQAGMVKVVKNQDCGMILEPATLAPFDTVADVDRIKAAHNWNGVVITDSGMVGGKIMGIVTSADIDSVDDRSTQLSAIMSRQLVLAREPINLGEAYAMMQQKKVGKLPIVNEDMSFVSMVTRRNLKKSAQNPKASRDSSGRLLCGAAVDAGGEGDWGRAVSLVEAGADVLYLDTFGAKNGFELDFIQRIKAEYPSIDVIAGPVTTCREAKWLCDAGVDSVCIGCGSLVPTASGDMSTVGRPEATAVFELSRYVTLNYGVPTIALGGIRDPGQILKALCLGAASVVLDDLLAGCEEAPGATVLHQGACARLHHNGELHPAMAHRLPGKAEVSKHKVSPVYMNNPVMIKGSVEALLPYLVRCVQNGMQDIGIATVPKLHEALNDSTLRLECRSAFALQVTEANKQKLQHSEQPYVMNASV